jgi:signal transduction histidine kinase
MLPRAGSGRRATLAATTVSRVAGCIALAIALSVFVAWAEKAAGAVGLSPWLVRTNPVSAVCLALSGAALLLPRTALPSLAGAVRLAIGFVVAAVGVVKLSQLLMGVPLGIDALLFPHSVTASGPLVMSSGSAVAYTFMGASLVLSSVHGRQAARASQTVVLGALAIATAGLISYAYGAINMLDFPAPNAMSIQSATGLIAVSLGVLAIRPRRAVTGLVTDATFGGATARRLLPVIALTTISLGALRVAMARAGMLNEVTGIALLIAAVLTVLGIAVLVLAGDLRELSRRLAARERTLRQTAAELKEARDAAASVAKDRADFIANVSHEIRNPLSVIMAYTERMTMRDGLDHVTRTDLSRIDSAAQALLSVVNDVLDFSQLEAAQIAIRPAPADASALLAEAAQMFEEPANAKGLELGVRLRSAMPARLLIDRDRVLQVLMNLIGNAVKFTQSGSVLVLAGYDVRSARLEVDIEDTGPGLNEAQRERLFTRFSKVETTPLRASGGAGLGLAICKGLVEAMGGEIGVKPRKGGGAVFHVSLPAPAAPGKATAAGGRAASGLG